MLAKNVLEGKTKGYKNHPQLDRFKASILPIDAIHYYLRSVWSEAAKRNYNFDIKKFVEISDIEQIKVTIGQIDFERNHLLTKLEVRDEKKYNEIIDTINFETHPLFSLISGEIEPWEKT